MVEWLNGWLGGWMIGKLKGSVGSCEGGRRELKGVVSGGKLRFHHSGEARQRSFFKIYNGSL
jgi:hypothetical protein